MQSASHRSATGGKDAVAAVSIALLAFVVFLPVVEAKFIDMDDPDYVTRNNRVAGGLTTDGIRWAFSTFHAANWHPLTWLSLQADASLWKLDPRGYHLTNVLLHSANAALLFLTMRALIGGFWPSFAAALLFAVHPLRVESVAWVSERKDVLSTFFGLLALLAYVRYAAKPTVRAYLAVVLALALSLLAKPMLVTLPFLLLVLDWWPLERVSSAGDWPRLALEKAPLIALGVASSAVTVIAQGSAMASLGRLTLVARLENATVACATYLWQSIWPARLAPYYPIPPDGWTANRVAVSAAALASLTILCLWQRRDRPYLLVGWLWFLGTLVPVLGLIQVGKQAYADRYTYFAQIGLLLAGTRLVADLAAGLPKVAIGFAAALAVVLAGATQQQLEYWHDTLTLWHHDVDTVGASPWALTHLGVALIQQGRDAEATARFRQVLELDPDSFDARVNLANLLRRAGQLLEAEGQLTVANNLRPGVPAVQISLGNLYYQQGNLDGAVRRFEEAIRIEPASADAYNNLGTVELARKNPVRAAECYRRALEIQPDNVVYRRELAGSLRDVAAGLARAGQFEQAAVVARQARDHAVAAAESALVRELESRIARYQRRESDTPVGTP
jgi:tetratricopeptide (TPR) repeat protein